MAYNKILENKFNGDKEAYSKFMSELGKRGGKNKVPKGMAKWPEHKHKKVSSKGGKIKSERIRRGKEIL